MKFESNIHHERYYKLASKSRQLRADGIYEQALSIHRECLDLAQKMQDERRIASCRFWIGECLYQLGRKEEALIILAPNLAKSARGSADDLYNSMTKYIIIALDLPANKNSIEEAIELTWSYLRNIGRLEWQHKLLYLEAELYQMQGKRELALEKALAGWALWRDEYPLFVADAHLYQIVMFQIRLHKVDDARRTIAEWQNNQHNSFPSYRASVLGRSRSYLNRLTGNLELAKYFAQQSVQLTERMQTPESLTTMLINSAWTDILTEDFDTARTTISRIPLDIARRKAVTIGDYHLSKARSLCGLEPVDIVLVPEFPGLPATLKSTPGIQRELKQARAMYRIGLERARLFDRAFECTWRQDEIQLCLTHIDELEKRLV